MKAIVKTFLPLLLILVSVIGVQAQDFERDPNAHFTWPPPVYLLRGEVELRGTANLSNMSSYFIEFRQLNDDMSVDDSRSWTPATLPNRGPVVDDVLGTWNTEVAPDGLYELRMTINVRGGTPVYVILSPLRVENEPPPFVISPTPRPIPTLVPGSPTPPPFIPTLVPTPTAIDLTPRVESTVNANVRQGDSVFFPIVDSLPAGQEAEIIGLSSTGSGWYQILLPNGRTGWISPVVVRVLGNLREVPRVPPPPPPPPTNTPTPTVQVNLVIGTVTLDPTPPRCGEVYTLRVQVTNVGTSNSGGAGAITVQDTHAASGNVAGSTTGTFPALNPGESFESVMRLTVDTYYNETHRLTIVADAFNQIPETNESDNGRIVDYTLQQAGCS